MGRAIVRDPQVFLFDEPLSNLDAKLRVQMRAEIKELHQRLKTTTIYVTHDQVEAMTMADKIVVMRDGIIEQMGSPLDLYDRPQNVFVAGFIGSPSMNFIKGKMDGSTFVTDDGVEAAGAQGRSARGDVRHPAGASPYSTDNGIPIEVVVLEPTGSETQVLGAHREAVDQRHLPRTCPGGAGLDAQGFARSLGGSPVRRRRATGQLGRHAPVTLRNHVKRRWQRD